MIHNAPVLIVILPLAMALLSLLFSFIKRELAGYLTVLGLLGSFACTVLVLREVLMNGPVHYYMGNWEPPYGIEFVIDPVNGTIAVMVAFIALLSAIYSVPFLEEEGRVRYAGYYSLLSLLAVGLLGMTITGDVFNLYVFLEIASLAGYGLIAYGGNKGSLAAFRYLLIGTVGASLYLLGIGYFFAMTGTLNMVDLSSRLAPFLQFSSVWLPMALIIVGFGIKMALFPMHGWQPDAYSYAHPGAAGLIAGVMAKVPAYAILRFFFTILDPAMPAVKTAMNVVGIMACIGILFGSVLAIAQKDFRRMLAYSSVAQVGYIAVGFAIGNVYALTGAVLHIIAHAFMKGGLFMTAGGIRYRYEIVKYENFGQLYKKMPVTVMVIVIAGLSMIGIPPTAGFFSKWYLGLGAVKAGEYGYLAILLISSLLNAAYFFRVFEKIFMSPESKYTMNSKRNIDSRTQQAEGAKAQQAEDANTQQAVNANARQAEDTKAQQAEDAKTERPAEPKAPGSRPGRLELPWQMLLPMAAMGIAVIVIGFCNASLVTDILLPAWPEVIHS